MDGHNRYREELGYYPRWVIGTLWLGVPMVTWLMVAAGVMALQDRSEATVAAALPGDIPPAVAGPAAARLPPVPDPKTGR